VQPFRLPAVFWPVDAAAYQETVLLLKDTVFSYAAYLLGNAEEARDVTQEALVRLWERRDHVTPGEGARPWLVRIVHNLALDRLRAARNGRGFAVDPDGLAALAADGDTSPDRRAALRETVEAISGALALLAPRDRGVLLMRDVHGLRYDEMAEVLGLPLGTLKSVVHRARERLREKLLAAGVRPA